MTASSTPAPKPKPKAPEASGGRHAAPNGEKTGETAASSAESKAAAKPAAAKPALTKPAAASPAAQAKPAAAGTAVTTPSDPSIGKLVSDATTHLSNLVHSEIELAKLELRSTVKNAGTGAGLFGAAAVVLVFSLTFGFFALAEGIAAMGLDRWLAFLIVFVLQLLAVGLCVYVGIKKVKRVKAPARTIKTTRETVDYLKKSRG